MQWLAFVAVVAVVVFEAKPGAWPFMLLAVLAAWLVVRRLPPVQSAPLSLTGLLRFLPYFLARSVAGGVDVALRAFRGRSAVRPGFVRFRTSIGTADGRVLFANVVSLLPGTLTARLDGAELLVHTLDTRRPVAARLRALERRVADMFVDVS